MPDMILVDSSNIEAVGYDESSSELHVRFRKGSTYCYRNVPPSIFEEFIAANSKGSYLNRIIKPNYPDCTKI